MKPQNSCILLARSGCSSFGAFCFLAAEDGEQSFVASKVGARTEPSYESMRRGLQLTTGRIEDTGTVGSV